MEAQYCSRPHVLELRIGKGCCNAGATLAGTHAQFRSAAAAARADPSLVISSPRAEARGAGCCCDAEGRTPACGCRASEVGLRAALGAARERALELELRLQGLEASARAQVGGFAQLG